MTNDPIALAKMAILTHVGILASSPSFDKELDRLLSYLIRTTSIAVLNMIDEIVADVVSQGERGVDEG